MKRDWRLGVALVLLPVSTFFGLSFGGDYAFFRAQEAVDLSGGNPMAPFYCISHCPTYPADKVYKFILAASTLAVALALLLWSFIKPSK